MLCLIISLWLSVYPLIIHTAPQDIKLPLQEAIKTQHNSEASQGPEVVLIFISLNLPDNFLKCLYQETKKSTIPTQLFLRELYQGSLQGTTERLKSLNIKAKIDPEWFECGDIKTAPTFIFLGKKAGPVVLHGNISLTFAIKQANEQAPH
jgi:type-F conjugative transfer system pilin assembly protein TrbC